MTAAPSTVHALMHDRFNSRDLDGVIACWRDDAVYLDHPRALTVTGGAQFRQWLTGWLTACSDGRLIGIRYLDAGDTSIACFTFTGTNDGPAGELPASGQSIVLPICELFRYDNDATVIGGEIYYDQATVLTQMGAAAASGSRT